MARFLSDQRDLWFLELAASSQALCTLYRSLEDPKQVDRAIRFGAFALERLTQNGGLDRHRMVREAQSIIGVHSNDVVLEQAAWRAGLKAAFSLTALYAVGQASGGERLQGKVSQFQKALTMGLRGVITAFPHDEASRLVSSAMTDGFEAFKSALAKDHEAGPDGGTPEDFQAISLWVEELRSGTLDRILALHPDWVPSAIRFIA